MVNEEASPPAPEARGLRIVWYVFAFAALIGGFLLVLNLILRHHTESQRHTCRVLLTQIEMTLLQYRLDHGLPGELTQLSEGARPLLDPWGRPFVYRVAPNSEYRLYSLGPDGVDENGKGDDVTAEN